MQCYISQSVSWPGKLQRKVHPIFRACFVMRLRHFLGHWSPVIGCSERPMIMGTCHQCQVWWCLCQGLITGLIPAQSSALKLASSSGNKKLWQVTLEFLKRFVCRLDEFQNWTQIGILLTQIKTFVGSMKFPRSAPLPFLTSQNMLSRSQRHEYARLRDSWSRES